MKIIKVGEISTVGLYVIWECEEFKGKLASYELKFSKMTNYKCLPVSLDNHYNISLLENNYFSLKQ